MNIRFHVIKSYDVTSRGGVLLLGKETEGMVRTGMVLRDETTGTVWEVMAVEFPTPKTIREGWTTIVVERTGETPPTEGTILTATLPDVVGQ